MTERAVGWIVENQADDFVSSVYPDFNEAEKLARLLVGAHGGQRIICDSTTGILAATVRSDAYDRIWTDTNDMFPDLI